MSSVGRIPPALKHGIYSATIVLPGENRADFEKLHRGLIAEFAPIGALEEDTVTTMARLIWRKRNLATIRTAELARKRYAEIISPPKGSDGAPNNEDSLEKILRMLGFSDGENLEQGSTPPRAGEDLSPSSTNVDFTAEREKERQFTEEKARKELGETYRLVEIGEAATFDALRQDLDIEERLDGMIDKCLKRLLHLRALKSISASTPAPRLRLAEHPKLIQRPS
jgi:hypothetical protein